MAFSLQERFSWNWGCPQASDNSQNKRAAKGNMKRPREIGPSFAVYHLTENYYINNSETIMDVNNYIPFSIINSQTIDEM